MGLDTTHDAFHGAYSAFNRFRQFVGSLCGVEYPPHWVHIGDGSLVCCDGRPLREGEPYRPAAYKADREEKFFYCSDGFRDRHPGLMEFFLHSDCEGEISPETCALIAEEMTALLPLAAESTWRSEGHIAYRGGYYAVMKKFIEGCQKAADANQPLGFH